ncbi:hypothetical protein WJX73_008515 [Symbiochloris irregularis]|uniref:Uncharacterized protein n=1 Tax=Symbiochloris irregularis TaxID=706552 RepID=A0AAW1PFW2_9CHLO
MTRWKQVPESSPAPSTILIASPSPSPLRFQVLPIAKELINRAHSVHVVNLSSLSVEPPPVVAECEAAGVTLLQCAPPDLSKMPRMPSVFSRWTDTDWLSPNTQAWRMVECVADFFSEFDNAFETSFQAASAALASMPSSPDLLIIHGFDDAWINLAHKEHLPYAIFTPLPLGLRGWYGDVPAAPSGIYPVSAAQAMTLRGRATKLAGYLWMSIRQCRSKVALNHTKRRLGLATYWLTNALWKGHTVITTWPWGLEPAREASPQLQHVGFPCLPWKAPQDLKDLSAENQELIAWLDDNLANGIVFLAYGSMLKMGWMLDAQRHHLLLTAITAFAAAKGAKVLLSLPAFEGDSAAIKGVLTKVGSAEGTIRQEPWVDQPMVLEHAATRVFVSHCGQMSVGNAVVSRTPLLAVPVTTDGYANAMRVQDAARRRPNQEGS